ncbi:prenyltransferase/squalene oxidase repeat-containing protein [Streptomyces sp. NPDC048636]|uniref:prenyltransferase/squalene oxidase repeat-containing protein n=1 Tax=Streptomyces sp. NPDC048636 TaxID=3155762 RepID=UPI00341AA01F
MIVRRSVAALAVSAALCAAAAPAALADGKPAPKGSGAALPKGLYGTKDPKFDGVWRQSLALLAQDAVEVTPAKSAVDWLAGQQCADGGFAAYRADTAKPCDAKKGEFSDATAAAVQALAAVGGRAKAVEKGIGWLKRNQNEDGGWGMNPGGASDANSTSAAVGALAATSVDPAEVTSAESGKTPYDALLGLQLGCDAKADERGAFAYQKAKGGPAANDLATASAALAVRGSGLVPDTEGKGSAAEPKPLACGDSAKDRTPEQAAEGAADYLATTMAGHGDHLLSAMPGAKDQPDFGGTADAIVALSAGGHRTAAAKPLAWLQSKEGSAVAWAKGDPGALAKLVLASHAAGGDPRDFGGVDLVRQLNATGPKPQAASGPEASAESDKKDDGDGNGVWWVVGICAVAGMGIGFLISGRKKQRV